MFPHSTLGFRNNKSLNCTPGKISKKLTRKHGELQISFDANIKDKKLDNWVWIRLVSIILKRQLFTYPVKVLIMYLSSFASFVCKTLDCACCNVDSTWLEYMHWAARLLKRLLLRSKRCIFVVGNYLVR